MKNLLKKFGVMIASLMLVMTTFVMPSYAATPTSFQVNGLEKDVQATAYRIVVQQDDSKADKGATKLVIADSIKDVEKPTEAEIMALIPQVQATAYGDLEGSQKLGPVTANASGVAEFTGASSGMYLVTFTNTAAAEFVYNPVIVSINYDDTEAPAFTTGGNFKVKDDATNYYVKKTKVPFSKVVERSTDFGRTGAKGSNAENAQTDKDEALIDTDGKTNTTNKGEESANDANRGDTAGLIKDSEGNAVGDSVTFRINSTVPAYADNFFKSKGYFAVEGTSDPVEYEVEVPGANANISKDPEYVVYDSMTQGLTLDQNSVKVYIANTNTLIDSKYYSIVYNDNVAGAISADSAAKLHNGDKFAITFNAGGIAKYRGQAIEIRYDATINGKHGVNFDGEKNTGGVDYTRNPGEDKKPGKDETTHHYTFTINGKVDGNGSIENREVLKVGVDQSGDQVFRETTAKNETGWEPLVGVKFNLYKKIKGATTAADYKDAEVIRVATSDTDGLLRGIDQIDAGEYVLIESDLGNGKLSTGESYKDKYNINDTPIKVKIEADLDEDTGRLLAYRVYVGDICVGHYEKTYPANSNPATAGTITYLNDNNQVVSQSHTCEYTGADGTVTNYIMKGDANYEAVAKEALDYDQDAAHIRNSKVGTLPSTGGMGTILFTIGGIVVIGLAFLLLMGGRRKQHQK